jgi:hypothetical protein
MKKGLPEKEALFIGVCRRLSQKKNQERQILGTPSSSSAIYRRTPDQAMKG